jgi:peptidyl-prolyl cis-trans isomerase B (cyclophilin B)
MTARLYNSTPLHRDNFIKLVKQGFYDSLLFHRVINGFMIQGGDPTSKRADSITQLGAGEVPGVPMVPAEFRSNLIHKKGVLAAARDNNPEKKSSNCQFYIVQGKKTDSAQLNNGIAYTKEQKEIYQRIGGTPFLDQNYTVFGEVFIGMDVIDKIAATPCYPGDRPVKNVRMKIKILN